MKKLLAFAVLFSTLSLKAQIYTSLIGVQGSGIDRVLDVAFAPNGDLIIEGCFNQTVVFGDTTLVPDFGGDTFVGRMDPNGQWLWVRNTGGQQGYYGQLIIDPAGDIIVLVNNYRLLKLNGAGDELWVRDQPTMRVSSMALMEDEVLVNGAFNFTTIFGPDTFTTANFYTDAFVGRISASTGESDQGLARAWQRLIGCRGRLGHRRHSPREHAVHAQRREPGDLRRGRHPLFPGRCEPHVRCGNGHLRPCALVDVLHRGCHKATV